MSYRIALDPDLEISPEQFVEAWNAAPQSRDRAEARLERATGARFDQGLMEIVLSVGRDVSVGIASAALYDIVKETVTHLTGGRHAHQKLKMMELDQSDGSCVVVVTRDEEG